MKGVDNIFYHIAGKCATGEKKSKKLGDFFEKGVDIAWRVCYNKKAVRHLGVAQLGARYLGVVEAAGSSPVTQIEKNSTY